MWNRKGPNNKIYKLQAQEERQGCRDRENGVLESYRKDDSYQPDLWENKIRRQEETKLRDDVPER